MCGLFAIINHHKRQLDKRAFITLGCANDSRGGDACGIMIDRKVDRGTAKEDQHFIDWYPKSELLTNTEKCYVALGHCRKASVGGVAPDKAQPVTIYDKDGNMLFCMIHNGTIYNYKELAKKYIPDVKIDGLTDSQVMAQIFFHAGYEALGEYNGGGAFIIQDYRINKTLLFKGESKGSLNAKTTEVERPLYMVKTGKSVIFSSILSVLQGLYWGFITYDVPSNVLLSCDGLDIYVVKEYDRSNCLSRKIYTSTIVTTSNDFNFGTYGVYSGSTYNPKVDFDTFEGLYFSTAGEKLHGVIHVSNFGYISKYASSYNNPYYFWQGIMISGEQAYNAIRDLHAQKVPDTVLTNLARRLSCNPVRINKRYYTFDKDNKKVPFDGDFYDMPLTDTELYFNGSGKCIAETYTNNIELFIPVNLSKEKINKIVDYVKGIQ